MCNSYEEATKKAELAEETSDFNEEYEKLLNPNNRKFYKRKQDSSSDEDEEVLSKSKCSKKRKKQEDSIPTSPISEEKDMYNLPTPPRQIMLTGKFHDLLISFLIINKLNVGIIKHFVMF